MEKLQSQTLNLPNIYGLNWKQIIKKEFNTTNSTKKNKNQDKKKWNQMLGGEIEKKIN